MTAAMPFVVPVSSLVATIIDAWGEVVAEVSAPDEAHIAANTPQGCTALACRAPLNAYWDTDAAQWVSRGVTSPRIFMRGAQAQRPGLTRVRRPRSWLTSGGYQGAARRNAGPVGLALDPSG